MTSIESILKDIEQLPTQELTTLTNKLLKKVNIIEKVSNILLEYQGIGQGIWTIDAQDYVNLLRTDDRI